MSARSLFDTFYRMGMTEEEAYKECERQKMFTECELHELVRNDK